MVRFAFGTALACIWIGGALAQTCGMAEAFRRADEGGRTRLPVYEGKPEAGLGGARPLAFVSPLKVNTDGTRISYKVDDPQAKNGAINTVFMAMNKPWELARFEAVAKANWPLPQTWKVLNAGVIEKNKKTQKPCIGKDNYLVSMTSEVSVDGGHARHGDCDQSKWLDALEVPALVLPKQEKVNGVPVPTEFDARGATNRNLVVVMTLGAPNRLAFGIVGDKGPIDQLGEASVAMNRDLNGLPAGSIPTNYRDAVARFQGPRSLVLIFPTGQHRAARPLTADRIKVEAEKRLAAWGGRDRLLACAKELQDD